MCSLSAAKSHFIDFVEITSDLLLIAVTFDSDPRGWKYCTCQKTSAVSGEQEASCAVVTVWMEMMCDALPCKKQRK